MASPEYVDPFLKQGFDGDRPSVGPDVRCAFDWRLLVAVRASGVVVTVDVIVLICFVVSCGYTDFWARQIKTIDMCVYYIGPLWPSTMRKCVVNF